MSNNIAQSVVELLPASPVVLCDGGSVANLYLLRATPILKNIHPATGGFYRKFLALKKLDIHAAFGVQELYKEGSNLILNVQTCSTPLPID